MSAHFSKALAVELHANRRAEERYGLLDPATKTEIARRCRKIVKAWGRPCGEELERLQIVIMRRPGRGHGHGRARLRVTVGATTYDIVWDRHAKRIVTFLP